MGRWTGGQCVVVLLADGKKLRETTTASWSPHVNEIRSSLLFPFFLSSFPLFSFINYLLSQITIMVHLASVKNDDQVFDPKSRSVESIAAPQPDENDFYTNVYGSHFAADHLPQHEIPEREMPRQVAARMIKDELSLDGNPKLK